MKYSGFPPNMAEKYDRQLHNGLSSKTDFTRTLNSSRAIFGIASNASEVDIAIVTVHEKSRGFLRKRRGRERRRKRDKQSHDGEAAATILKTTGTTIHVRSYVEDAAGLSAPKIRRDENFG